MSVAIMWAAQMSAEIIWRQVQLTVQQPKAVLIHREIIKAVIWAAAEQMQIHSLHLMFGSVQTVTAV